MIITPIKQAFLDQLVELVECEVIASQRKLDRPFKFGELEKLTEKGMREVAKDLYYGTKGLRPLKNLAESTPPFDGEGLKHP